MAAAQHLITGRQGEAAAASYLKRQGYKILHRNWRRGGLELDLVCREGDELVFVEVRTRSQGGLTPARETLDAAKRAKVVQAAQHYLSELDLWDAPCRFDFISVEKQGRELRVEHTRHAFEFSQALGGGHTPWQPW